MIHTILFRFCKFSLILGCWICAITAAVAAPASAAVINLPVPASSTVSSANVALPVQQTAANPVLAVADKPNVTQPSAKGQANAPTPAAAATPAANAPAAPTILPPVPTPGPQSASAKTSNSPSPIIPAPPEINAAAYLLIDANSGYVIAQNNADSRRAPASLTKLMTMYVLSGFIKSGRIKMTDPVTISENAWRTGGSRMFVQVGTQVPVEDLVHGIIVASGNDACVSMAEFAAGSESSFVNLMNQTAAQLSMKDTNYADSTGLPNPANYTTAYDLAKLSRAIIQNYPEDYKWYSQKWMMYNNIKQPNRNLLLWRDPSVDGLKTGHTDEAGFCLVASAVRQNTRLIAIVLGAPSMKDRAVDIQALLNYGYRFFETHQLYTKDQQLANLKTYYGRNKETPLGIANPLYVTVPIGQYKKLNANLMVDKTLEAPIVKGKSYGTVQVMLNNQVVGTQPLVALADNPKAGFMSRTIDKVSLWVKGWFEHSS